MSVAEIDEFLALPLVPVLSVSRRDRGPVAVPMWYGYEGGVFSLITAPDSLHGRLIRSQGRATLTFHDEHYGARATIERYVHAEGPVEFIEDEIEPVVIAHRRRYHTGPDAETWIGRPLSAEGARQRIVLLRPESMTGYRWEASV